MAQFPAPAEGMLVTYFIVSADVERSRRFYTEVLGGEAVLTGDPSIVALANGWVTLSVAGEPTDDKPRRHPPAARGSRTCLRLPQHPRRRHPRRLPAVERPRRAVPHPAGRPRHEIRCYMRDPDGHLIEVGQLVASIG